MSASPFRATSGPFIEVPVPVNPDSLSDGKKGLEDIPFEAGTTIHEFPSPEASDSRSDYPPKRRVGGWMAKLFRGRAERRLREEMLSAELQDLRASYAGLLHSTEDIRDRMDHEKENRENITQALSPFPAAVAGIERLQTRQEEAREVLGTIRERLDLTSSRDETLLSSMERIHGGVDELSSDVGAVHTGIETVSKSMTSIVAAQSAASASLGDFGEKMEQRFDQAAVTAKVNAERFGQSSDDVLQVLRQMERNSQRGVWIFAALIAVLFFALIGFSAKMSEFTAKSTPEEGITPTVESVIPTESEPLAAEPVATVLTDDFEF